MERSYKFKFSIVMAVYNVEQFLREAIHSVISQDIGFKEKVQLILVNDGSLDSSGKICDEYGELYPENIVVVHKENGGVSSARNEGLKYIEGQYVIFLDSDDKLDCSTLRLVGDFFDKNYELTDVVSIPIEFFDGQTGNHLLNYKFKKGTRVVDLSIVYNYIQLSLSAAFIKYEDAKDIIFDADLKYAEDAKVCLQILDRKRTLGVISEAKYYYRKRLTGESSAIQKSGKNVDWYMPYLENFTYSIINQYVSKDKAIPWFVQYTLMYDLQWRFKTEYDLIVSVLGAENSKTFINKLYGCLQYLDDEIILRQKNLYPEHKSFLLKKKYGKDIELYVDGNGEYALYLNQHMLIRLGRCQTKLEFLSIDENSICIEALNTYIGNKDDICCEQYVGVNGSFAKCNQVIEHVIPIYCLDEIIAYKVGFKAVISLAELNLEGQLNIGIYDKVGLEYIKRTNLVIGKFFPVVKKFKNAYSTIKGYVIQLKNSNLVISKSNSMTRCIHELKLLKEYIKYHGTVGKKAAIARCLYHMAKPFFRKEIWLISDRINKADDNGEALFKYINDNNKPVNSYFVLHKDSLDFGAVSQIGKTLKYRSWKHKLYHLLADKWISAAGDEFVSNPFFCIEQFYRDILRKKKASIFTTWNY